MAFCCRQVLLVVRRLTSSSSRAASSRKQQGVLVYIYSTVSDVTLGIFRRNSGAGSSFSGIVFCCRQVRLLLVRSTSVAVTASSSSKTSDKTSEDNSFFHGFTRNVSRSKSSVVHGSVSCRRTRPVDPRHKDRG